MESCLLEFGGVVWGWGSYWGRGGDTSGAWGCVEEDPGLFRGGGVGGFLGKSGSFGGALRVGPSHLGRGGLRLRGTGGTTPGVDRGHGGGCAWLVGGQGRR